ncbi:MAG: hypothetical protein V1792_16535 [Pseudomonadota bacterium]
MADEMKNRGNEPGSGKGAEEVAGGPPASLNKADSPASEEMKGAQEREEITNNHIAQKRGRMVAAGFIASVILAVIAVTVAGIFQFTSGWLVKCPSDLPVNDPAPILWKDVESKEAKSAPLGVPEDLMKQVGWKGSPAKSGSSPAGPK